MRSSPNSKIPSCAHRRSGRQTPLFSASRNSRSPRRRGSRPQTKKKSRARKKWRWAKAGSSTSPAACRCSKGSRKSGSGKKKPGNSPTLRRTKRSGKPAGRKRRRPKLRLPAKGRKRSGAKCANSPSRPGQPPRLLPRSCTRTTTKKRKKKNRSPMTFCSKGTRTTSPTPFRTWGKKSSGCASGPFCCFCCWPSGWRQRCCPSCRSRCPR